MINPFNLDSESIYQIIDLVDASIYWKDRAGHYLGCNKYVVRMAGLTSREEIIGKTDYDLVWKDLAPQFNEIDNLAILNGHYEGEESIIFANEHEKKVFKSIKSQLIDNQGNVIGIVGVSMDLTAQKEAEKLRNENRQLEVINKMNQVIMEKETQFRKIVDQAAHDIRSPLSSMATIVKTTLEIPEAKRIALRDVAISISDITRGLLNQFEPQDENTISENNKPQLLLASLALNDVVSDRRHRYKNLPIKIDYTPDKLSDFAFIKIEPSHFRRMITNLLNNAVDAMPQKGGKIMVSFIARDNDVYISIEDNGKGIPKAILNKIKHKNNVTHGKKDGHGIGLSQVRETLERNNGEFEIYSRIGKNHGTEIVLTLPRMPMPNWIAEEISFTKDDLIIVLDDDASIHEAWDSRFAHILEKVPTIRIKHFTQGLEVIKFIKSLKDTQNVCLLSDYELIKQGINGLEVIKKTKIKRATLVTSHYKDIEVRKMAVTHGVRILPKELAHTVSLKIIQAKAPGELSHVHMIIIDDDILFINTLIAEYYSHLVIDTYTNPYEFLNKVDQYPLDTKIILDNNLYNEDKSNTVNGIGIAMQLHKMGFTRLYLISGRENVDTPPYLTSIFKEDEETLSKLDKL